MTIIEVIQHLIDGETLVNGVGGELSFDPCYTYPFRFRIRNCEGRLIDNTFPVRSFKGDWRVKTISDDPADWMEKPEYVRAKLWMDRCNEARAENFDLHFRIKQLEDKMRNIELKELKGATS